MSADGTPDEAVRLTFDGEADCAYVALGDAPGPGGVTRSIPVGLGGADHDVDLVLDIDANGRLLGVEVLGASMRLAPEVLAAARRLDG